MPKTTLCQNKAKTMNDALFAEVARGMRIKGKDDFEVHKYIGVSRTCWYNRRGTPENFRLDELRRLFSSLNTSNAAILAIFGRKEDKP